MDGPGFHVDLAALAAASSGITQTLKDMDTIEIDDICGPPEEYGSDELHDAFSGFCERWQHGTDVLLKDAEGLRDVLDGAVLAYLHGDSDADKVLNPFNKIILRVTNQ